MTHLALDRAAACGFVILQLAAKIGDFGRTQGLDRKMVTAVLIGRDFHVAQEFRHGRPPVLLLLRPLAAPETTVPPGSGAVKKRKTRAPAPADKPFARRALTLKSDRTVDTRGCG